MARARTRQLNRRLFYSLKHYIQLVNSNLFPPKFLSSVVALWICILLFSSTLAFYFSLIPQHYYKYNFLST